MQGLQAKHRAPNEQTKNSIKVVSSKDDVKEADQERAAPVKTTLQYEIKKPAEKSPQLKKPSPEPEILKEADPSPTVNSHIWGKKS
jgi:hypothetical protein